MVGVRDLAIVRVLAILSAVRLRRIVWAVRIIQMQPQEKRAVWRPLAAEPVYGMRYALFCAAIHEANVFVLEGFGRKSIIVKIETARQTPATVKYERADHSASRVPILFERLSEGTELGIERVAREVLDSVLEWICAGENCGVRRPSERHLCNSALKDNAIMGQAVEGWSFDVGISVAAEVIGPNGVDRDQNDTRCGPADWSDPRLCGRKARQHGQDNQRTGKYLHG